MENKEFYLEIQDDTGNGYVYEYNNPLEYLMEHNHAHDKDTYKIVKAIVNGKQLENVSDGRIGDNYFRDLWDFKIWCRKNCCRKIIKTDIPQWAVDKFLLGTITDREKQTLNKLISQDKNLENFFTNGGGGMCEYRPGYISGYDYSNKQGVKISWINEQGNECEGIVKRSTLAKSIKELIVKGIYLSVKDRLNPCMGFVADKKQLKGQLNLFDWSGGN